MPIPILEKLSVGTYVFINKRFRIVRQLLDWWGFLILTSAARYEYFIEIGGTPNEKVVGNTLLNAGTSLIGKVHDRSVHTVICLNVCKVKELTGRTTHERIVFVKIDS